MPTCGWQPSCPSHGRQNGPIQTLTHEWLHHLQGQLSALQGWRASPVWMIEGPAIWAELQLPTGRRNTPSDTERKSLLTGVARTTATLQSVERPYTQLAYRLGVIAAERLAERSDTDAHVEYNRHLYPQTTGKERRWVITPTWQDAFQAAFGLTAAAFYEEFAAWRETLPTPARRYNYGQADATLTGTVHYHSGSPAAGFRIEAKANVDGFNVDLARTTIVDAAGNFSIEVAPETMQRIQITRDGCTLWLTDDGLTDTRPAAGEYRDLDTANLPRLNLKVPVGACGEASAQVEVLRLRGDDRRVHVGLLSDSEHIWGKPQHYGDTYSLSASRPGPYRVMVRVGGCDLWYAPGGLVASGEDADEIDLSEDLSALDLRIPHDLCVRQISGRLINVDGAAISRVWLTASGDGMSGGAHPDANGEFAITVPDSGAYSLSFGVDGCWISHSSSGANADWRQATRISVEDESVTGIEFVVPADPAGLCN